MEETRTFDGEIVPWDDYLDQALSETEHFDYGLLRALRAHQNREREGIHVSDIVSCLRKAYYHRTVETSPTFPHESLYTFLGTMTHGMLEGSDHKVWTELPIRADMGGVEIVGQADAYYPAQKRLVDYKTTRYINPANLPYGNHVEQVQYYACILHDMGLPVEQAFIQYIDLSGPTRCRYCKVGTLDPTPEFYICRNCGHEWERDDARIHLGAVLVEAELPSMAFIRDRMTERIQTLIGSLAEETLPRGEPGFLCSYCPFREICDAAE